MLLSDPRMMIMAIPGILFGFTIHEFAHAYVAYRLGDDTAERQGRLTLNPLSHLDPMGTILILLAGFGWARPVPVNPVHFKNPRRDSVLVTVAGPASNMVMAIAFAILMLLIPGARTEGTMAASFSLVLRMAIYFNLLLCFFNLLPVFPLDGARILQGLLPLNQAYAFSRLEPMGPMILIGMIALGQFAGINIIGTLILPPIYFFMSILT